MRLMHIPASAAEVVRVMHFACIRHGEGGPSRAVPAVPDSSVMQATCINEEGPPRRRKMCITPAVGALEHSREGRATP